MSRACDHERVGAPSLESILDAGYEVCAIGGEIVETGETVLVSADGDRACRAHADGLAREEEWRLRE